MATLAPALPAAKHSVPRAAGWASRRRSVLKLPSRQQPGVEAPPWGNYISLQGSFKAAPPQLAYAAGMRCSLSAAMLTCLRCCSAAEGVYGAPGPPSQQFRVASAQPLKASLPAPRRLQPATRPRPSGRLGSSTAGRRAAGGLHSGGEGARACGHRDRRHTSRHGMLRECHLHLPALLVPGFYLTVGYSALPPLHRHGRRLLTLETHLAQYYYDAQGRRYRSKNEVRQSLLRRAPLSHRLPASRLLPLAAHLPSAPFAKDADAARQ